MIMLSYLEASNMPVHEVLVLTVLAGSDGSAKPAYLSSLMFICLLDSLRPINILSVKQGRVFLG